MFSEEFVTNRVLQWALGALIFNYYIVFSKWIGQSTITMTAADANRFVCPAYFQNCDSLYFLQALPQGYSLTFAYMLMMGVLLWAVYLLSQHKWKETQLVLIPLFVWHFANVLIFTAQQSGNYEYYLIVFGTVLLFLPHKEFFLKLLLVLFYVLSTVTKNHPAWIEGGYFANLYTGLPAFPNWSIPILSNLVILMEMVGSWFLLSKHQLLQRTVLVFFVIFHLYSGILVEYRYPATVLPMLLIVFGPLYSHTPVPLDKRSTLGWVFVVLLFLLQFTPHFISGDEKLTLEGNSYSLYMFESNHQCISDTTVYFKDGTEFSNTRVSASARSRCAPYSYWFRLKQSCHLDPNIERITWTFDHSINGDPFLRIVDVANVCDLEYKPFSHNDWIKRSEDNPEVMGLPVKNYYE